MRPRSASVSDSVTGTSTSASAGLASAGSPELATTVHPADGPRAAPLATEVDSSRVTDSMPNASRTRSSTAFTARWPRSTLPAVVTSSSDSAVARAACLVRRAAVSTTELTSSATMTNTPSARALFVSAIVNWWIGGVK